MIYEEASLYAGSYKDEKIEDDNKAESLVSFVVFLSFDPATVIR